MRRLRAAPGVVVLAAVILLAVDYIRVSRQERALSDAVAECGGRMFSIPFWPSGTEYRIVFPAVPAESARRELRVANTIRGSITIVFVDTVLSAEERSNWQQELPECRLEFVSTQK